MPINLKARLLAKWERITGVAALREQVRTLQVELTGHDAALTRFDKSLTFMYRKLKKARQEVKDLTAEFEEHDHDDEYVATEDLDQAVSTGLETFLRDEWDFFQDPSFTGQLEDWLKENVLEAISEAAKKHA